MAEQASFTEENKKTIIAFVTGLLVGGLLVYIFTLPSETPTDNEVSSDNVVELEEETEEEAQEDIADNEPIGSSTSTPTTGTSSVVTGDGDVSVEDQEAGSRVFLSGVTYPADTGWIGVRDYENGRLTGLLGVSRWSRAEGLLPQSVGLLRSTEAGKTYAVVFYSDNGDKVFNLATDAQTGNSIGTFIAR